LDYQAWIAWKASLMHTNGSPFAPLLIMQISHRNKTLATLLAATLGGIGAHRFYLFGKKDFWGWTHAASLPLTAVLFGLRPYQPMFFMAAPLIISILIALLEALVLGLTPDDKWDAQYNSSSGRRSSSGWPLAVILVLTLGIGAIVVIATIARTFDLIFTGGAYG